MTEIEREMRAYYDRRAREYDEWYEGTGKFAARELPGWHAEVGEVSTCRRDSRPRACSTWPAARPS